MHTPESAWERDVYGHIEIAHPELSRPVRIIPVEWRPLHPHDNRGRGPPEHRFRTLTDRWHPFDINAPLGIDVFLQAAVGIAVPLPREIANFSEYCNLCAELWNCPDVRLVPAPEWREDLL